MINFRFNNHLNAEKEDKKDAKISSKVLFSQNGIQNQSLSNNTPKKSNFQNIDLQNKNNNNFNNSSENKSKAIFSSKILPTYNFNAAQQTNKNGSTMSSLQKKQSFSRGGNMRHRKSDANFTNN